MLECSISGGGIAMGFQCVGWIIEVLFIFFAGGNGKEVVVVFIICGIGLFVFGIGFVFMGKCVIDRCDVVEFLQVLVEKGGVGFGRCHDCCFDELTMVSGIRSAVSGEFQGQCECGVGYLVTFVFRVNVGSGVGCFTHRGC